MKSVVTALFVLGMSTLSLAATQKEEVHFLSPKNGDTVAQKFTMEFEAKGIQVEPAGKDVDNKKAGHFHVIVDGDAMTNGQVIPADPTHIHYGKGQTEGEITLAPGDHKLTLQFADGAHRSSGKPLSETITVHVK